ncbi:hypothetical protein GIB67_030921 [Kingdonia uniflora]|uniref:Uncharacterized protein n=1 Tax=Kingdonia uniflora TaxID=39325 RepID=A0A7J7L3J8_9MAGN|nr:hypothetical protein GIB67_030921 [Kingdonia uniflora]
MTKKIESEEEDIELLKAVAQAWYAHSGNTKPTNEFDAYQNNFKSKPTRFKLEAMLPKKVVDHVDANWDFKESLWDSYEIVTVSRRLEVGLVLDHPIPELEGSNRVSKKPKESKNSLRNLFHRLTSSSSSSSSSSNRFDNVNIR